MAIAEIEQALEHFKTGQPSEAIPVLENVVDLVPTYVLAHVLLAQAYEACGQDEKAVLAWRQAYRMIPNSPVLPLSKEEAALTDVFKQSIVTSISEDRDSVVQEDSSGIGMPAPPITRKTGGGPSRTDTDEGDPSMHSPGDGLLLRAHALVKKYRKRSVVKAVELQVRQGEIVGLLGPNGAGKTTTFYMIVGMIRPDGGDVFLGEECITTLPMFERARRGIGYLAQEASIFGQLSVEDNLHAVLEYQDMDRGQRQERVEELIDEFGLERVRKSKGYMLSGGERRRTEIARALATRPSFFLLDEPFAGVDPIAVEDIQAIVRALKARGIGVLITDHNVHETLAITDRAYLLYEGMILKQGTAEALASDPEVRRRYLGEKFTLERYQ